jgi:hypothetical protein
MNGKTQISEKLIELKSEIIEGMLAYMQPDDDDDDFDPGYTEEGVNKCAQILTEYLATVFEPSAQGNTEKIMSAVKKTVLELNDLNAECEHSLIETDQREGICELIISAAAEAGLQSEEYDITGEWREW